MNIKMMNKMNAMSEAKTSAARNSQGSVSVSGIAAAASLTILVLLFFHGCAVGPDYRRPETPTAQSYTREPLETTVSAPVAGGEAQTYQPDAEIPSQWWQLFGSELLNELVQQAFANNPTIDSAHAALRQARAYASAQRSAFFPTLEAGYSAGRQREPTGTIAPTLESGDSIYTLHTAQLALAYAPDIFGLNRRKVESLVAEAEMHRFQLSAAYLTLAANVVTTVIEEASLREQIKASEEIVAAATRMLTSIKLQAELGFSSGIDVAAQETELAKAEQALPPLRKELEQMRNRLAVLTGRLPAQGDTPVITLESLQLPQELPLRLPSQLIEQRPDVRAAEAQVHAASALVGVAVANRLPQFFISATYGGSSTQFRRMFADGNRFWSISGNAAQTIFAAGGLYRLQKAAEAALDQTTADYRGVVLAAFQEVADTLYALDADAKELAAAAMSEKAAKKYYDLTQHQLKVGYIDSLTLLNATQAYQQTRIALIKVQASRYADTVALFQALGGGWGAEPKP